MAREVSAAKSKASKMDVTGVFRPAQPEDVSDVLKMYAIAARVVALQPDDVGDLTKRLGVLISSLVPPESVAAAHCHKMWLMFSRLATAGKPSVREQAGRAFVRDLDQVGRHLDVPPIDGWDALPMGVDAPGALIMDLSDATSPGETLDTVKRRAAAQKDGKGGLEPQAVADLVRALFPEERDRLLMKLIGDGVLGRSEVSLIVRWLTKGGKLGKEDDALADVLQRLGTWLGK